MNRITLYFKVSFWLCFCVSSAMAQAQELIPYHKGAQWGYADANKKVVTAPQYSMVYKFSEGLSLVSKGGKYGYIDATGKEVIPAKYSLAENFSEGWARVGVFEGGKIQRIFIDKSGKTVWKPEYEQLKT